MVIALVTTLNVDGICFSHENISCVLAAAAAFMLRPPPLLPPLTLLVFWAITSGPSSSLPLTLSATVTNQYNKNANFSRGILCAKKASWSSESRSRITPSISPWRPDVIESRSLFIIAPVAEDECLRTLLKMSNTSGSAIAEFKLATASTAAVGWFSVIARNRAFETDLPRVLLDPLRKSPFRWLFRSFASLAPVHWAHLAAQRRPFSASWTIVNVYHLQRGLSRGCHKRDK